MTLPAAEMTEDDFLGGRLRLRQPSKGYRAGVDAVLLAAAAPVTSGSRQRVLDVGAGIGTVGLCLATRVDDVTAMLIERAPDFARLARENIALNGLGDRVSLIEADIMSRSAELEAAGLSPEAFDHSLANPPYHDTSAGTLARDGKAGAHAMPTEDLDRWARFLARMTKQGGTTTLIHKAEAIADLLAALAPRFGALRILPIHSRPAAPAIRILIQGVRGSRSPLKLLAPFVLHGAEGHGFTPEASAILRQGAALDLGA